MATIFLSYSGRDLALAQAVEKRLEGKGHKPRIAAGTALAGNWRMKLTKGLAGAEAQVAILTENALSSPYVLGEVGAGRVLEYARGMLLLPVLVGETEKTPIPDFVSDIFCFRLTGSDGPRLDELAEQLDKAIRDHVRMVPRVFISHRHKDEPVAARLTALLEQAFYIEPSDIRCTSVQPYMLTPGERTSEQLRADIAGAELVIGVLSPDATESNYVLCELGASWGRDVPTFPVLVRGALPADVPSPLNERHCTSLEDPNNCLQLVDYIANKTSLRRREGNIGKVAQQSQLLAEAARPESKPTAEVRPPAKPGRKARSGRRPPPKKPGKPAGRSK